MKMYEYSALATQPPGFRLLKLRSGENIRIEGEIVHATISADDTVPYEALSYTWGSTELIDNIFINGRSLYITESLYSALLCLRHRDHDRVLWIDAICINQSDRKEQSEQVAAMGTIFGQATQVIFWLGKPTFDVTVFLIFLQDIQTKVFALVQESVGGQDMSEATVRHIALQILKSQTTDRRARIQVGLKTLLQRPWFERVWILQEVRNARSAIVCSGTVSVSAYIFAIAPSVLGIDHHPHVKAVLELMPGLTGTSIRSDRERDKLSDLLARFYACKATDKRDMIFALLAMSSELKNHKYLQPDYTKSLPNVVQGTLRYWFEVANLTIPEAIRCLAKLEAVHITCLVTIDRTTEANETVTIPLDLRRSISNGEFAPDIIEGTISCVRDPSLFLLEDTSEQSKDHDALHIELAQLPSKRDATNNPFEMESFDDIVRLVEGLRPNVKFLVINDIEEALSFLSMYGLKQMTRFILQRTKHNRRKLLYDILVNARELFWGNMSLLLDEGALIDNFGPEYAEVLPLLCMEGRIEEVRLILKWGIDVNTYFPRSRRRSALHGACSGGHASLVELLLKHGAHVNAHDHARVTPILEAAHNGHVEVIRLLLKYGADINPIQGSSLIAAWAANYPTVAQSLLKHGTALNSRARCQGSALEAAIRRGHVQVVQLLLEHGADVNRHTEAYHCPLQIAVSGERPTGSRLGIVKLLLEAGADPNACKQCGHVLDIVQGRRHEERLEHYFSRLQGERRLITQLLLDTGATFDTTTKVDDEDLSDRKALLKMVPSPRGPWHLPHEL